MRGRPIAVSRIDRLFAGRAEPSAAGASGAAGPAARGSGRARLEELDLLRFLAALAVVVFHYMAASKSLWGVQPTRIFPSVAPLSVLGILGVELFFVISGFVILMSVMGRTAGEFAISRFTRLFPAYWFSVLAIFLLYTLVERLRRLEEMEIARNHLHRYAATLDNPTPEAVAALFTDDGILRTGRGTAVGRTSIADFYRRLLERDPSEKRHFITSPHTTWLAPGLVEIASYFLSTGRGTNRSVLGWGAYLDRIRIVDGTPLIAEKTIELHVGTDLHTGWPA